MADNGQKGLTRTAFVTIGATAGFRSLLEEVISEKFLKTLQSLKFTDLVVQCGPDMDFFEAVKPRNAMESYGLNITSFSYAPDLADYFIQASHSDDEGSRRARGIIISHAGLFELLGSLYISSPSIFRVR
jgi:beta-1,4-N-acetylglucosaminyltransferase